jgi:WD repeat-containing protein 35
MPQNTMLNVVGWN